MITVWKTTKLRCNPHAPYTDENGTRHLKVPDELYEEVADPAQPGDYCHDTYYRTEQDDAPYVAYTKKTDSAVAAIQIEKEKASIRELEQAVHDGYMKVSRQFMIQVMQTLAAQQAITHDQLYAANKGYKAIFDLEASIVPKRDVINDLEKLL